MRIFFFFFTLRKADRTYNPNDENETSKTSVLVKITKIFAAMMAKTGKNTHTHTHTTAQERPQKRWRDGKRRKPYSRVRISRPKVVYRVYTYNLTYEWSYVLYVFWWGIWGGGGVCTQHSTTPCSSLSVDLKNWKLKIKGFLGFKKKALCMSIEALSF